MSTEHDAHLARWTMMRTVKQVPYNPDNAIPAYFREHPEVGSPLGPELGLEGGGVVQAFTGAVLRWVPGVGVEVVTA